MASGRKNRLTGQIAEHLVCAELGRHGFIATPFSGNVPTFDIIAANDRCETVPIQVKASNSDNWPTDARLWMDLKLDRETGIQHYGGAIDISDSGLIYVCVVVQPPDANRADRFFVLTKADIQKACIDSYTPWMETKGWRRPRNPASYDCRYRIEQLAPFENNWNLISERLAPIANDGTPDRDAAG